MKAISIAQPWAYLIAAGYKDIENRSWPTEYRGPLLILATMKKPTLDDMQEAEQQCRRQRIPLPEAFELGGIVGIANLVDCVTLSRSKWFEGPYGFVLAEARSVPFVPCRGQLGLFEVHGYDHLVDDYPSRTVTELVDDYPLPPITARPGWLKKIRNKIAK